MARICAEDAHKHALILETFGRKLIENQVIGSKFSAMGRNLDSAYSWMEQLVYISERAPGDGTDKALGGLFANLKVLAGRTLEMVNREAKCQKDAEATCKVDENALTTTQNVECDREKKAAETTLSTCTASNEELQREKDGALSNYSTCQASEAQILQHKVAAENYYNLTLVRARVRAFSLPGLFHGVLSTTESIMLLCSKLRLLWG
jgi:hypothetical protein